jgi:hypothetical protein
MKCPTLLEATENLNLLSDKRTTRKPTVEPPKQHSKATDTASSDRGKEASKNDTTKKNSLAEEDAEKGMEDLNLRRT